MSNKQTFEVKDEHIKLLRHANVWWWDCEFGAPCIDPKRPYGNSNIYGDINRVCEFGFKTDDETSDYSKIEYAIMDEAHKATKLALQISLATGEMRIGKGIIYLTDQEFHSTMSSVR